MVRESRLERLSYLAATFFARGAAALFFAGAFLPLDAATDARSAQRPDQAQLLLAGEDERAERRDALLLHRLEQQHVRAPLRLGAGGHEEVGTVEVDRVDLLDMDEARDVDRARALRGARLER